MVTECGVRWGKCEVCVCICSLWPVRWAMRTALQDSINPYHKYVLEHCFRLVTFHNNGNTRKHIIKRRNACYVITTWHLTQNEQHQSKNTKHWISHLHDLFKLRCMLGNTVQHLALQNSFTIKKKRCQKGCRTLKVWFQHSCSSTFGMALTRLGLILMESWSNLGS